MGVPGDPGDSSDSEGNVELKLELEGGDLAEGAGVDDQVLDLELGEVAGDVEAIDEDGGVSDQATKCEVDGELGSSVGGLDVELKAEVGVHRDFLVSSGDGKSIDVSQVGPYVDWLIWPVVCRDTLESLVKVASGKADRS